MRKKITAICFCLTLLTAQVNAQTISQVVPIPDQNLSVTAIDAITAQQNEVIRLVNVERAKVRLKPLVATTGISKVAKVKAQDMATKNYFSHTSPTYGSPFTMMKTFGIRYTAAGENIAKGQTSAAAVMNSWMHSPGHKANILSSSFTQIGVGLAKDSSGINYWVQEFIKP